MKKLLLILIALPMIGFGQDDCVRLMNEVKRYNVTHTNNISKSSFLNKVTLYEKKNNVFFAIVKMNNKEYVYCNIGIGDYIGYVGNIEQLSPSPPSEGERFYKYIAKYDCDCN